MHCERPAACVLSIVDCSRVPSRVVERTGLMTALRNQKMYLKGGVTTSCPPDIVSQDRQGRDIAYPDEKLPILGLKRFHYLKITTDIVM